MAVPYVYFEKDPSVSCYDGWICLGGKVWVKDGDYITVYFDVKNGSTAEVAYVKVKIKDISGLNNCDEQEKVKNIDPNSTYSDYFFVWPKGPCQLQLTVEVYDYDRDEFVQTDSKCCFDVSTYETTPGVDLQVSLDKTMLPEKLRKGDTYTLKVTVQDYPWGNLLDGITVHFYEDGVWKECKISNGTGYGTAVFSYTPTKTGTVTLKFEATTGGATATTEESFEVTEKYPTAVSIFYGCSCTAGESFEVSAYLSYIVGDKYYALAGKTLDFYIGGVKKASATTDSSGNAKVTLTCPSRSEKLEVKFAGDANYEPSSDSCTLYITTPTPTPTPTPPPTTPTPTPTPGPTPTPTPTPGPGPPPAPKARFEFESAGFHYWKTTEFKPEDFVSVSYDVENDEWKEEGETITEHLVPDTASALFFSGTVRQKETGASAVCEVRVYDELNDEVLLTVNSEEEISGEFSFGNQTYFYDGKERRIRIQVGAYEGGTWFKQDETEPLTLKGGKIAIEIKIKNVPEGVEPCVTIETTSGSYKQSTKYGERVFWTEEEIEKDREYRINLEEKKRILGLIEVCLCRAWEVDKITYTGTKIEKEYDWETSVPFMPSWYSDVCGFIGLTGPLCSKLWETFADFEEHLYVEATHTDPHTGQPREPDTLTHIFCALDFLGLVFPEGKGVSEVIERGGTIAKFARVSEKVSDWIENIISKSKLLRGIAGMSDETFEKKFLDKLVAEDFKAAEDLLDSAISAPFDSADDVLLRIVDAADEFRTVLKNEGRTADDIATAFRESGLYAAHAEQVEAIAVDVLKTWGDNWIGPLKAFESMKKAWHGKDADFIYDLVREGIWYGDLTEEAGITLKALKGGTEQAVEVSFKDIFYAYFLKEGKTAELAKAGVLDDFLKDFAVFYRDKPYVFRRLIQQLSDSEFATIVADLKAEGKYAHAALFEGLKEAAAREGAEGATILSVRSGEAAKANLDEIVKKLGDAWDSAKGATPETRKAADSLCNDMIANLKLTKTEEEYLSGKGLDETIETLKKDSDPKVRDVGEKLGKWWEDFKKNANEWLKRKGKSWDTATKGEKAKGILHSFFFPEGEEAWVCKSLLLTPMTTEGALWAAFHVSDFLNYFRLKELSEEEIQRRVIWSKGLCAAVGIAVAIDLWSLAAVYRKCPHHYKLVSTVGILAVLDGRGSYLASCGMYVMDMERRGESLLNEAVTLLIKTNVDGAYVIIDGCEQATRTSSARYIPYNIRYVDNSIRKRDYAEELVGELPSGQMDFWITVFKPGYFPKQILYTIFPSDKGTEKKIYVELEPLPEEYKEVFSDIIQDVEDLYAEKEEGFENIPAPCGGYAHPRIFEYDVTDVATVNVDSSPAGAEIWIYDEDAGWLAAGITPSYGKAKIKLPPGTWKVKLVRREDDRIVEEVEKEVTVYHGGIATPSEIYVKFEAPHPTAVISYYPSDIYVGTEVTFDGSGSSGGDTESIVSYTWHFGDGTTATGSVVKHTFAKAGKYTVSLAVTNESGNTAIATRTITVKEVSPTPTPTPPPCPSPSGVAISISPSSPTTDDIITFTGSAVDGDGHAIVSWEWNFGDGATASGQVVTHRFTKAGSYKVVLKVTNDCGAYATGSKTITVSEAGTPPPGCPKPTANISYIETTKPYEEQEIELSASGSLGGDTRSIVSYEWDFGDGESATGVEVKHAWKKAGKYTVTLKVTNDCGATDTDTTTVTVNAINDVCDLIKARGGPTGITSVDIQQMILAYHDIISYYFKPTYNAIVGVAAYYRGDISSGDYWTKCHFSESAGFLRLWRLLERMRRS